MQQALRLAAAGEGYVEPNPMVGAVITDADNGRVLGEGFHRRFGAPHAEVEAIRNARESGNPISGANLYVNLEPCAHRGKTPPCTDALIEAGFGKVYIAAEDPMWKKHAAARGGGGRRGIDALRAAKVDVNVGLCREAALMLNAAFYKRAAQNMPLVTAKWAMSADGKIATRTGSSRWISSPQSRDLVHRLRGKVDAILIGAGTASCDDPHLTCREGELRRTALRVVLCGETAPGEGSNLVRTARHIPLLLAFPESQPPPGGKKLEALGCEMMPLAPIDSRSPARVDPRALLHELARRGAANILVEGGSTVLGCFFDAGLIDRAMIYIAPFIVGGASAVTPLGGQGVDSIKHAAPLVGPVVVQGDRSIPDGPFTDVKPVGKDIMLCGWLRDPRNWISDSFSGSVLNKRQGRGRKPAS